MPDTWRCGATQGVRTLAVPPAAGDAAGAAAAGAAAAGVAAVWRAPAPLVTAAVLGSAAAVGAGATAHVLLVDAATGARWGADCALGPASARGNARRAACAPTSRSPCAKVTAAASRALGRPPASGRGLQLPAPLSVLEHVSGAEALTAVRPCARARGRRAGAAAGAALRAAAVGARAVRARARRPAVGGRRAVGRERRGAAAAARHAGRLRARRRGRGRGRAWCGAWLRG